MTSDGSSGIPTLLFGAFDRHNFGDLLLPHVAAALLRGGDPVFAGLAAADLRAHGGHRVAAIAQLAADWGGRPLNIIHVGGETLTCNAWQAAAMLLPPERAQDTIAGLDARAMARQEWVRRRLGVADLAPYTLRRNLFPGARRVVYNGVGGVDLDGCPAAMRDEVFAKLQAADAVGVRDRATLTQLASAGIAARLIPDPAVMVAELFGAKIRRRGDEGPVAQVRRAFSQGYLAVQFSADYGDDATLDEIAAQLGRGALASGYGVVLFRAGAAPWHDDLRVFERLAVRLPAAATRVFTSLDVWNICALIAASRAFCGSSLHGRIVAMAFALPRINLRHPLPAARTGKPAAFAATWEAAGVPAMVAVDELAEGILGALATDPGQRQRTAAELVSHYRQGFAAICAGL